tara:strand:+ start:187 stop:528 length:342 start_codon:yes stop_codon:yes gene_type:complete
MTGEDNLQAEDRRYFERKHNKGCTEIAEGTGNWAEKSYGKKRIIHLIAFYHPNGNVSTLENYEFEFSSGESSLPEESEEEYTGDEFQGHLNEFQIEMTERKSLSEVLDGMEEF